MKRLSAALFAATSLTALASECPIDAAALNAPNLLLEGVPIACDASPTAPGELNDCGVLRWVAANDPGIVALLREHKEFRDKCLQMGVSAEPCREGKFSAGFIAAQLQVAATEVRMLDENNPRASLAVSHLCALSARGLAPMAPPPKPLSILSERLTLTRDVADPNNSFAKGFEAPFVISYTNDREGDKSFVGLYGTIGYKFFDLAGGSALSSSLKIDTAGGSQREKSSAVLSVNYSRHFFPDSGPFQNWLLRISPQYLTDRDLEREAYQLKAQITPTSHGFLDAGYMLCPGGCDERSRHQFFWSPSLGLELGHVVDAGGSTNLLPVEGEDYARFAPSITMSYRPLGRFPKLLVQLDYTHRWDWDEDWDRGLGSLGIHYAVATNAFWSLSWKKGRQEGSFAPVDTVLFGFGVRQ